MQIPFLDLKAQYNSIKHEIDPAIQNVLDKCNFIMGEDVKKIEEEVAAFCGAKFGIGVASGTDALVLALWTLDLKPGDEIITTPFTFIATTEAISKTRAKITFVDIDPETYNIDPNKIAEYIKRFPPTCGESRTKFPPTCGESKTKFPPPCGEGKGGGIKAILPVHLYGHPCDMDPIMDIAKKHNLTVIEDCAQAIGAEYKGRRVGSIGDAGCLSFFPSKNLGCYGDGGMVVTNNEAMAKKIKVLRVHGCETKYYHLIDGFNSRLDTLQAAVLRVKLKYLDQWNTLRREKFLYYNELFAHVPSPLQGAKNGVPSPLWGGLGRGNNSHCDPTEGKQNNLNIILPSESNYARHAAYAYTIRVQRRAELMEFLKNNGIPTMIYYPVPLHLQDVYRNLGYKKGDFPVSEKLSDEVLSLPIYPELTKEQQEYIVQKIGEFYK